MCCCDINLYNKYVYFDKNKHHFTNKQYNTHICICKQKLPVQRLHSYLGMAAADKPEVPASQLTFSLSNKPNFKVIQWSPKVNEVDKLYIGQTYI